jgi:hypothetical protein
VLVDGAGGGEAEAEVEGLAGLGGVELHGAGAEGGEGPPQVHWSHLRR